MKDSPRVTLADLQQQALEEALREKPIASYPGSKNGSGVCETIIRNMPPHRVYMELFAGSAAVFRRKLPAAASILNDVDPVVANAVRHYCRHQRLENVEVLCDDAMRLLTSHPAVRSSDTLVYLDPPYLLETRTGRLYDFEFLSEPEHAALLDTIKRLPCMVMISGYWSSLYKTALRSWRTHTYVTMTRGGLKEEILWCNFPEPTLLHDARFAGAGYRERERMGRKRDRWAKRFAAMPRPERQLIASALAMVDRGALEAALLPAAPSAPAERTARDKASLVHDGDGGPTARPIEAAGRGED